MPRSQRQQTDSRGVLRRTWRLGRGAAGRGSGRPAPRLAAAPPAVRRQSSSQKDPTDATAAWFWVSSGPHPLI